MGEFDPWNPDLDLGDGHSLIWTSVDNPQMPLGEEEHYGAIIRHPVGPNKTKHEDFLGEGLCMGSITFHTLTSQDWTDRHDQKGRPMWEVLSWSPLTIRPSVLCSCGDHGFIREGRWVRA